MEQANVEKENRSQPEPASSENAISSYDALKKKADALERELKRWYGGELKSRWQTTLDDVVQTLGRRVEALEASRGRQAEEIKRLTEENRTLNNVVDALKQARQTQSEKNERLSQETQGLRNDVDELRQRVAALRQARQTQSGENERLSQETQGLRNDVDELRQRVAALNSSLPTGDASTVEKKASEEKYRAEIARLESEIRRLRENEKTLLAENKKLSEEIEAFKYNERQFEEVLNEKASEKRANDAKENADPHQETQGGAFAVNDANNECRDAQSEIYWALVESLNDAATDERFRREAVDYICELFDATFGDHWDDAPTPKSLAERWAVDDETASKIKEREEKIKANIVRLKEICARWLRENSSVEACRLYRPKPGESLEEREIWKSCKSLGNKRLNEIDAPPGGRVLLTLIPGIYSKTKGSRANLAPAYVVAQPNESPEVEKTQGKEVASQERELASSDFDLQLD
ncbi:MAG: hypothetical protein IJO06_01135 [Thermoguttaceae bacterium]|nr:hypothetical protein [Thermoguttaceae bacterium]